MEIKDKEYKEDKTYSSINIEQGLQKGLIEFNEDKTRITYHVKAQARGRRYTI